jgi:predicted lipoprotein with Yx(FWY)xxD motif
MKTKLFPVALASLSLVALAACGRGDDDDAAAAVVTQPAVAPATTAPATTSPPAADPIEFAAKVGESDLGKVMTSADGLTLYGFVNDNDAISTCYSTCANAWPPVIVDADWAVGPGLDTGVFATTERDDGTLQLVAGKYPLYTYGGDAAPGDTTGHGSGDVWFAMNLDGTLIEDAAAAPTESAPEATAAESSDPYAQSSATETTTPAEDDAPAEDEAPAADSAPAPITIASTDLGDVMVTSDGITVYAFTKDENGTPTCEGGCAEAWPPVIVDSAELPAGLDANIFSVVERPDGTQQLKAGKWPLYTFAGDEAPGDVNGQGSGEVWFVLDAAAKLIK